MDILNKRLEILQNAINTIGISFAIILYLNSSWDLKIHFTVILLSSSMILILLLLMDYNKSNITTYIAIFTAITCGIIYFIINKENIIKLARNIRIWFFEYQISKDNYQITYAMIILFLCILFIMLLIYCANKNKILRYGISLCLILWLSYCAIVGIRVNKVTIGILIIYMMQVVVELCNHIYNKTRHVSYITNIYLLPLCILIGVLSVSIPSKTQPIQWKPVKYLMQSITDKLEDFTFGFGVLLGKKPEEFSVNFIGYSDEGGTLLGGKLNKSNQVILKIQSVLNNNGSTYLIGNVHDEYTSKGWRKSEIDYYTEQEPTVDFYELLYGMYRKNLYPKENEILFNPVSLNIKYNEMRFKTIFYPLKTYGLEFSNSNFTYNSSSPTLLSKKILRKDFSYKVKFMEINYQSETIRNFLRDISKIPAQSFCKKDFISYINNVMNLQYLNKTIINEDFAMLLGMREKMIKEHYTRVPEQLPHRVRNLAEKITTNYDNNYDKLRAIESYLSAYKYTLSPSETKEGEDFVDYFLFEQKEGFCTYFATAMAILARCVDIPTRYVEGVIVDYSVKEDREYLVNSDSSHAWVEAYIEGAGWIPFEPTPSMYGNRYSQWEENLSESNKNLDTSISRFSDAHRKDKEQDVIISREKIQRVKYMQLVSCIIIIIILILFAGIILTFRHFKKKRYKNASNADKVKYLVRDIIDYLTMDGSELRLGETLSDYVHRLDAAYNFEGNFLEEICSIYMRMRYAEKEIDNIEILKITTYHNQLKNYVIKKMRWTNRIRYQFTLLIKL